MEEPTLCIHCDEWFDLSDGYGSEKWHDNTIICRNCHIKEEVEIEADDRWESINIDLVNALYDLDKEKELANRLQPCNKAKILLLAELLK
ncbi:hypothetical protein [Chryseobacterium caseinilyticum]|uniref:Uncharacterized protein n=1 Tax=Chryseobacterium caseinilyticum TaxID=2771428 RepID=A0ABR8Z7C6_9FLAO|nr:hypothetical protein [Chryseobacterium caseinilyticum]MBD8081111.1 hypothetical protein [Chryseobacterium caseinilyticum]